MALNLQRLERRKHGRKQAETILELVDLPHPDCVEAFLQELKEKLLPEIVSKEESKRERQLAELGSQTLSFGEHKGIPLSRVDRSYLQWLRDSSLETADMIGAYLDASSR